MFNHQKFLDWMKNSKEITDPEEMQKATGYEFGEGMSLREGDSVIQFGCGCHMTKQRQEQGKPLTYEVCVGNDDCFGSENAVALFLYVHWHLHECQ